MDGTGFQKVPASNLGVAEEIEKLSRTKLGSHYDIHDQLADISEKVEKAIQVNIQLQERITRLGEAIAELASDVKQMAEGREQVPEEPAIEEPIQEETELGLPALPPSPFETGGDIEEEIPEEEPERGPSRLAEEIKGLTEQNIELVKTLRAIDAKLDKSDVSDRIRKALEKTGVA